MIVERALSWVDERVGSGSFLKKAVRKAFPDHWSFMLGEVSLYSFLILLATGTFLGFVFSPSGDIVHYSGSYAPLAGATMTGAYDSALRISFDLPVGLLVRQTHHWAALIFLAAIVLHAARIFFTGAFRRPRELNYLIGISLFGMALLMGFTGYSLPDDDLSGTGLRIAQSVALSIPLVGTWLTSVLLGGDFPNTGLISRLFFIHVFVLPGIMVAALGAHLSLLWRQKHTQFPGPGRTENTVTGSPLWPQYALKSMALGAVLTAICVGLGAFAQINPIWQYGPYNAAYVAAPSQPDWFLSWLDGALRLAPGVVISVGPHHDISSVFFPGVVLPMIIFGVLYGWPFIEARVTGDRRAHHLLDRPRSKPLRSAMGVTGIAFVAMLTVAASFDVQASIVHIQLEGLRVFYQFAVIIVPLMAGLLTFVICRELNHANANAEPLSQRVDYERTPAGGFEERALPPVDVQ